VRDESGKIIAGARGAKGEFADSARTLSDYASVSALASRTVTPQHTTLCVVATNMVLERSELAQLARAAGAALFRRITPVGTSFDGDVVFAMCPPTGTRGALMPLELNAVAALEEAIERGVRLAKGRDGIPGLADAKR
jgi:L-aminopeptidase/D-esterase-like protein